MKQVGIVAGGESFLSALDLAAVLTLAAGWRACLVSTDPEPTQGPIIDQDPQVTSPADISTADRPVSDNLVLTTIDGAADLLLEDLQGLGSAQARTDDSVRCEMNAGVQDLLAIRTYRTAAIILDAKTSAVPDLAPVHRSLLEGVLSALAPADSIGFRVGLADPDHRRTVIDAVEAETGWSNRPDNWDINITQDDGDWIAEVGYLHYSRRFGRLKRQPWSTNPVLAAILVRIAKVAGDQRVHDPFCGTGTLLIAADQAAPSLQLSGTEIEAGTLDLARANLADTSVTARLRHTDAIPFPHPDGSLDRVLSNLPFGKQVGSHTSNIQLYPAVMSEIARTLRPKGRAVLLTEDKRLLLDAVAREKGIKIIKQRIFRYSGATPTAYTITRTRRS